jgi:hypothetical protein
MDCRCDNAVATTTSARRSAFMGVRPLMSEVVRDKRCDRSPTGGLGVGSADKCSTVMPSREMRLS